MNTATRLALVCLFVMKPQVEFQHISQSIIYYAAMGLFFLAMIHSAREDWVNSAPEKIQEEKEKTEEFEIQKNLSERMDFSKCTACRSAEFTLFKLEVCEDLNTRQTKLIPPLCGECLLRVMDNQIGVDFPDHLGLERPTA